jgi:hypothetical protein
VYLEVAGKRRKAFHSFQKFYRQWDTRYHTGYICYPAPYNYIKVWGQNLAISDYVTYQPIYPSTSDPFGGSNWQGGDINYYINYNSLYPIGSELRDFVIRDLYAKANAPLFDGAVFIAELNETLVEIKRILSGAVGALHKTGLIKARKSAKHLLLNPEEMWLWFRYFLMPAMMDVEDLIAATKGVVRIDRVQDGDRCEWTEISGSCDIAGTSCGGQTWSANFQSEYRYGLGGAIDMYSRFDPNPYGTSSWDVLRAIWERIPWSFVVDWVINVGDWLASLREIEIDYAQSYATFSIEARHSISFPDWTFTSGSSNIRCYCHLMDRIIDLDAPAVPLVDKHWGSTLRYIDSISLILAVIKRLVRRK